MGTGAALFGHTKLYGQIPGGQAEYLRAPFGDTLPLGARRPPDDRFVYLSDVLPTAWQAVEYADIPQGGSVTVLGLGPIGDMATRIARLRGADLVIGVDLVDAHLDRARQHGGRPAEPDLEDSVALRRQPARQAQHGGTRHGVRPTP